MLCSIFVRSKSLYQVADAVKEACKGFPVGRRARKVILQGEETKNPEEETETINIYVEFDRTLQLLFSVISLSDEIAAIHVLRDTEDLEFTEENAVADFIHDIIEFLLEKFGWDNVKWLLL